MKASVQPIFSLVIAAVLCVNARAATYSVTNTANSGPGSFRQAILDANFGIGISSRIEFSIPGPGPYRIQPTSPLPIISNPVVIDGTTQPGFAGQPIIELNGALAGASSVSGLVLSGGNSTVQGLVINGFSYFGIFLQTFGNNVIRANYVGTDRSGSIKVPNAWGIAVVGIPNNVIGGTTAADRNLISGNGGHGIEVAGPAATGNSVQGNLIGTNVTGNSSLGNSGSGVGLFGCVNTLVGGTNSAARNLISGNAAHGLLIAADGGSGAIARGTVIQGNFIGTDATGTAKLGNLSDGILIIGSPTNVVGGTNPGAGNLVSGNGINGIELIGSASTGNLIQGNLIGTDSNGTSPLGNLGSGLGLFGCVNTTVGGTTSAARNLISGNAINGLVIATDGGSGAIASGNKILGNFIGTDRTGAAEVGNGEDGIFISAGINNVIGGASAGSRNVISANGRLGRVNDGSSGVEIWDGASGNSVLGNLIGTDVNGINNLGNKEYGVFVQNSSRNTVGGPSAGAGNLIAFNQKDGVYVQSGTNDLIRGNFIFANAGLGLDLGTDGVTANDAGDADAGANNLQNHPVLTSAVANGNGSTTISGSLNSRANASFTLEFFANAACDPSGSGEGQQPIGLTSLTTGATGSNMFTVTFTNTIPAGQFITATATDSFTNTSEFCVCVRVLGQPHFATPVISGTDLTLAGAGGTPGGTYRVLSSTDLTLPSPDWPQISGGTFDAIGIFSVTLPLAAAEPQRLYAIAVP